MKTLTKRIITVCIVFTLCLAVLMPSASADFGSFSGESDFSYDYNDYDYDYDYGGSYDDDLGDAIAFGTGLMLGGGGGSSSLGAIIVIVAIVLIIMRNKKRKAGSGHANTIHVGSTGQPQLRGMNEYLAIDPQFDSAAMTQKISNLYVQMQNCWQDKDLEPLRPYFTDTLFTQYDRQADAMRAGGRTNYVERIAVMDVTLQGFYQSGGADFIVARLQTRIVDYTLNDADGTLVSGDRNKEKFMTYEWTLSRPSGKTSGSQSGMKDSKCPNCGAPLDINQSARCPYCDSVITTDDHDFVISAIRGISQRTMD